MWEYKFIEDADVKKVVNKLNELGKEGWEAFGYSQVLSSIRRNTHLVILKRQNA